VRRVTTLGIVAVVRETIHFVAATQDIAADGLAMHRARVLRGASVVATLR